MAKKHQWSTPLRVLRRSHHIVHHYPYLRCGQGCMCCLVANQPATTSLKRKPVATSVNQHRWCPELLTKQTTLNKTGGCHHHDVPLLRGDLASSKGSKHINYNLWDRKCTLFVPKTDNLSRSGCQGFAAICIEDQGPVNLQKKRAEQYRSFFLNPILSHNLCSYGFALWQSKAEHCSPWNNSGLVVYSEDCGCQEIGSPNPQCSNCLTMLVMIHFLVLLTFLGGATVDGADDAPPRFLLRRLLGAVTVGSSAPLRLGATALALSSRGALQFLPGGKGTTI